MDKLPYYNKKGKIAKWEEVSEHNIDKYIKMSNDNTDVFYHTPNKTLLYIVHIPDADAKTRDEYMEYYKSTLFEMTMSDTKIQEHGDLLIVNGYKLFASKVYHTILSL